MQKTRKKNEWITPDTWQAIEERRQLKKKINDSRSARIRVKYRTAYAETKRHVKRKIRTDKKAYMEGQEGKVGIYIALYSMLKALYNTLWGLCQTAYLGANYNLIREE